MNKFLIKNIDQNISNSTLCSTATMNHKSGQPFEITVELVAIEVDYNSMRKLANHLQYQKPITIESTEYYGWTEPFKKEFKEFLEERYPERILTDLKGFELMFGE